LMSACVLMRGAIVLASGGDVDLPANALA
jgi:hypothetical protein